MLRRRPSAAGNPAYRDDAVIGIANSFGNRIGVRETTMAKGQKRGNREIISDLSTVLYRPESPAGSLDGGNFIHK